VNANDLIRRGDVIKALSNLPVGEWTMLDAMSAVLDIPKPNTKEDAVVVLEMGLNCDRNKVTLLRKYAVERGWFEVPISCAYEVLRMVDTATGGKFAVYEGKRGTKAVANVGQRAAQRLLLDYRKFHPKGGEAR